LKISIITVCFNSSKTIEKTLQSILSQTYNNIEYIVVDGGSSDSTLEILKKYTKIISKLISEPDKGLYDAMNKGIKSATGDIVGILNSDDIYNDEKVIENIACFHNNNNNIEVSLGNIIQITDSGKITRKYSAKNWSPDKLKNGFMPPHPSIFIKRELFEEYGYYHLDFVSGADYELIVRFFLKNNILWKFSNITTTVMLIGGISTSGLSSYMLISKEICKALKKNEIKYNKLKVYFRGFWKLIGIF
jgi:glycosyltransferase involved in cell wall biosynthesis